MSRCAAFDGVAGPVGAADPRGGGGRGGAGVRSTDADRWPEGEGCRPWRRRYNQTHTATINRATFFFLSASMSINYGAHLNHIDCRSPSGMNSLGWIDLLWFVYGRLLTHKSEMRLCWSFFLKMLTIHLACRSFDPAVRRRHPAAPLRRGAHRGHRDADAVQSARRDVRQRPAHLRDHPATPRCLFSLSLSPSILLTHAHVGECFNYKKESTIAIQCFHYFVDKNRWLTNTRPRPSFLP